jgi:hypothetical protein
VVFEEHEQTDAEEDVEKKNHYCSNGGEMKTSERSNSLASAYTSHCGITSSLDNVLADQLLSDFELDISSKESEIRGTTSEDVPRLGI